MGRGYFRVTNNSYNFHSVLVGLTFFERMIASEYARVLPPPDSTSGVAAAGG